ncbi:MAG TPA: Maf family protein [Massilibacterium sp.]|nr:Maf family protein [Massilibacterium sp.]
MKIILASQSPRRKELMQLLNHPFEVIPSAFNEEIITKTNPKEYVITLAKEKAQSVFTTQKDTSCLVIGADTIVVYNEVIFGKPTNEKEARKMLEHLSEKTHQVYTGVALVSTDKQSFFCEKTDVTFYKLTSAEITDYLKTGEPFDKAGSYGIQGYGALFVKQIVGDYYNVVGLPVARLKRELQSFLEGSKSICNENHVKG